MSIKKLDARVLSLLHSQTTINSFPIILKELVHNSIDAGSSIIKIYIDFTNLRIKIIDNGAGLSPSELSVVGNKNFTSKLSNLSQLKSLQTYGFRGESLFSISKISKLSVVSKNKDYNSSFIKTFVSSAGDLVMNADSVPDSDLVSGVHGTIVDVEDIFHNFPVRKIQFLKISKFKIIEDIRLVLLYISVSYPGVSIKVFEVEENKNNSHSILSTGNDLENIPIHESYMKILNSIYGINLSFNFEKLEATFEQITLTGILSTKTTQTKNYQFMTINRKPFLDPEFQTMINKLFQSVEFGSNDMVIPSFNSSSQLSPKKFKSPTKVKNVGRPFNKYPIFVLCIRCPQSSSDVLNDAVFTNKYVDVIKTMVLKTFKMFLKLNNYNVSVNGKEDSIADFPANEYGPSKTKLILNSNGKFSKINNDEIGGRLINGGKNMTMEYFEPSKFNINDLRARLNSKIEKDSKDVPKIFEAIQPDASTTITDLIFQISCGNHNHEIPKINDQKISEYLNDFTKYKIINKNLKDCEIISQIDFKFILIKMNLKNLENDLDEANLMIIDQHACDERINVESYFKKFISSCYDPNDNLAEPINNESITFEINFVEENLFERYKTNFSMWGIQYDIIISSNHLPTLNITHLPQLIINKTINDLTFLKKTLLQYLYDLQTKKKSAFLPSVWNEQDWFETVSKLPKIIIDIINSKACRSSIMFGDPLSMNACQEMIRKLSDCKSPFQCAHGRPSIIPIAGLNDFDRNDIYDMSL